MRIQRGFPQQSSNSAGQVLGPREPATLYRPPVVTTLSVNLATGLLTNQRRVQLRRSEQVRWQPQRRVTAATGTGNDSPSGGILISTSGTQYAQQFTVGRAVRLADVQLVLGLNFNPTDSVTFELHADSGGTPDVPVLASTTIRARDFSSGSGGLFSIPLGATLAAGSYWVVLSRTGATDASNNIVWYDIGGPTLSPATTARNTGSGWATGAFLRALTLLTQLVYDDVSAQLPMIGVKPPTQINAPSPVVTTLDVNFAARGRETIRRFPLQGWDGGGATGGTVGTAVLDLYDGGSGSGDGIGVLGINPALAQSFAGLGGHLSYVEVSVLAEGSPLDNLIAEIRPDDGTGVAPSNTVLATASIAGTALTSSFAPVRFSLSFDLDPSQLYWCVLRRSGADDPSNYYRWEIPTVPTAFHADGFDGATWQDLNPDRLRLRVAATYAGTPVLTRRNLGPRPPLVVTPFPSQPQQTITAKALPVSVVRRQQAQQRRPKSLLFPPTVLANPPPLENVVRVHTSRARRLSDESRFPLQGWEGWGAIDALGPTGSKSFYGYKRNLGPWPPLLQNPLPTQQQQTVQVNPATGLLTNQRRAQQRRTTHTGLQPPTVILPPFIAPPVTVSGVFATQNRRRHVRQFPLQGWEGGGAVDRLSGFAYSTPNGSPLIFGDSFGDGGAIAGYGIDFTNIGGAFDFVEVAVRRTGTPTDNLVVEIRTDSAGVPSNTVLASATVAGSTLPTASQFTRLALASITVNRLQTYWIVLRRDGANDGSNYYVLFEGATSAGGRGAFFDGASWVAGGSFWAHGIGIEATAGSKSFYGYKRNLGPWPPLLQNPLPTQQQQTVSVRSARVRRATPVFSRLAAPTVVTTAAFIPPPIAVSLATIRNIAARRFPLQGWEQREADEGASTGSTVTSTVDNTLQTSGVKAGSSFTALGTNLIAVSTWWEAGGVPVDQIVVEVQSDTGGKPSGVVLASTQFTPRTVPSVPTENKLPLAVSGLTPGANYWLVAYRTGSTDTANFFQWDRQSSASGPGWRATFTGTWSVPVRSQYAAVAYFSDVSGPQTPLALLSRRLGPRPPLLLAQTLATLGQQTVKVNLQPKVRRAAPVFSRLSPPTVVTTAAFVAAPITVKLAAARPRATRSVLPKTIVAAAFAARPVSVTLAKRPRRASVAFLRPPAVLATFAAGRPALTRTRPRPTIAKLSRPTVVRVPSVEQREQTITVSLARIRPRATRASLPEIIVSARFVAAPVAVAVARIRPRRTARQLFPPTALQVFAGPTVNRVRSRPRQTVRFLEAPTVLLVPSVEQQRRTLRAPLVRTRPRPTVKRLTPPTVVRVPSVEQQEDTIRVALVRTRPRHTIAAVEPPTVLQTFAGPVVHETQIRPRPTRHFVAPPTVVRVPSVEQQEDTIKVSLARIRPRPTIRVLAGPTTLQTFAGPLAPLVRTRPRPTVAKLAGPTVVLVPSVEQQEDTVKVVLARIRPRATVRLLGPPQALRVFFGPNVTVARIKPRATVARVKPPTVVIPAPGQRAQTITVWLAGRTRVEASRRAPHSLLRPPAVVSRPPVGEIVVSLAEPRNRRDLPRRFPFQGFRQRLVRQTGTTVTNQLRDPFLGPRPPQIQDPLPTLRVQTIAATLVAVRTRREIPRHVVKWFLRPPTRIIGLPSLRMQTVQVATVRTRPRHTIYLLGEPTVVDRTLYSAPETPLVRTRPRHTTSYLFEPAVLRVPTIEQQLRTIKTSLVKTRPRPTVRTLEAPTAVLIPQVEQARRTIKVTLAKIRPRPTTRTLNPPQALRVFAAGRPALTRIRPPHTISRLRPPTVLQEFFGPVETEIAVRTVTEQRRHAPHSRLFPPTVFAPTVTRIKVALARIRPRPTTRRLAAPTVVTGVVFAPIKITLARIRPAQTRSRLRPPATLARTFRGIAVALAPARRPHPASRLAAPTVVAAAAPVETTIRVTLAVAADRRAHVPVQHLLPPVLPVVFGQPGATTGYDVPASTTDGTSVPADTTDGDDRAGAGTAGGALPSAGTTIRDRPGAATDGRDERSM